MNLSFYAVDYITANITTTDVLLLLHTSLYCRTLIKKNKQTRTELKCCLQFMSFSLELKIFKGIFILSVCSCTQIITEFSSKSMKIKVQFTGTILKTVLQFFASLSVFYLL